MYHKIDFLTREQIDGEDSLEIFKHYGLNSTVTDYAIILGGDENINENLSGTWSTKSASKTNQLIVASHNGDLTSTNPNNKNIYARPCIKYSDIKSKSQKINKINNNVFEIEWGEYPQKMVSETLHYNLETAYQDGKLETTNKKYTNFSEEISAIESSEYVYKNKKYIRVIVKNDGVYWLKVDPIRWIVDKDKDIAITKNLLFGGPLDTKTFYKGDFESTLMKEFLDDYVSEEIFTDSKSRESVNSIIDKISSKIVGQEKAITDIVANIYANQLLIDTENRELIDSQKVSILLDGPTGTGKTAILKAVAEEFDIPIEIVNASSFSATGYVGSSITDVLENIYLNAEEDLENAERGIIVFDEIDKLGGYKTEDITMHTAVQQELLSIISGSKVDLFTSSLFNEPVQFDTSNITFIGMGAFTELRNIKKQEEKDKNKYIGFNSNPEKETNDIEITQEDLIDYGLERELIGRFSLLTSTKQYNKQDYINILTESEISPLKGLIEFAEGFDVTITYDDEFVDAVADLASKQDFGARSLQKIIASIKNKLLVGIMSGKIKEYNLTSEMLKKPNGKIITKKIM